MSTPYLRRLRSVLRPDSHGTKSCDVWSGCEAQSGRMQLVVTSSGAHILDDSYKGPWESFKASLESLATLPADRKIAILSDLAQIRGNVGDTYRCLGARLVNTTDFVVLLGSKDLKRPVAGAVAAGMSRSQLVYVGTDIHKAIDIMKSELRPGVLVLIKGGPRKRLARIKLALLGRDVRCNARTCNTKVSSCDSCPLPRRLFSTIRLFGVSCSRSLTSIET